MTNDNLYIMLASLFTIQLDKILKLNINNFNNVSILLLGTVGDFASKIENRMKIFLKQG
jgi:hypothetical protein